LIIAAMASHLACLPRHAGFRFQPASLSAPRDFGQPLILLAGHITPRRRAFRRRDDFAID